MSAHEHVKKLVNLGFLVDDKLKEKIEGLSEEKLSELVDGLKKQNAFMVDEPVLKTLLSEDVKVLKTHQSMENFTIHDYVGVLNEKYGFLKNLLVKKLELSDIVSIKECSSGKVTIIGLVNTKDEKDDKYLLSLEDPTEEIKALVPRKTGEKVDLDDVIAVSGEINNNAMLAERVIFPDMPFKPVSYASEPLKVAFTDKDVKADYVVSFETIKDNVKCKEHKISAPTLFKIGNITFLLLSGADPLNVLRKRYVKMRDRDFVVDYEPDIVFTDSEVSTNYKGISIVTKDNIIDLKTREVTKI